LRTMCSIGSASVSTMLLSMRTSRPSTANSSISPGAARDRGRRGETD
jgi:hypothetical protein